MSHNDGQPRSPVSPHFYGQSGPSIGSNGLPSPSSGRFPAIAARGGNFLQPVSQPPTRPQARRPSQGSSLAFPSPPLLQPSHPQSPNHLESKVDTSPTSSGHPYALSTPRGPRKGSQEGPYGAVGGGHYPSGPTTPTTTSPSVYSQPSPKDSRWPPSSSPSGPPSDSRSAPPSSSRPQRQPSYTSQTASPTNYEPLRAPSPSNRQRYHSPSLPSALASPTSTRHQQSRTISDPNMRVGTMSLERDGRPGQLGGVGEESFGEDGRLDEVESRVRKGSLDHRARESLLAPSPSKFYPSANNGGRGTVPPPRPQPPSKGLYSPPESTSSFPTPLHPAARPNNQRGTSTPMFGTQSLSAASPPFRNSQHPRSSSDMHRSLSGQGEGPLEEFGGVASPKKEKILTPKKSSGVLRGLFGKKKDSISSPSPPVPKSSISSPQAPSTPNASRTPSREIPEGAPPRQHESPASPIRPSPGASARSGRPSFDSSATPFDSSSGSAAPSRSAQPPSAFKLSSPPPRPTPPRRSDLVSAQSTSISSFDSSPGPPGSKPPHPIAHFRRGSDGSSSSSLSYLAGSTPLARSLSSSPPSSFQPRMSPNATLHPHLKPSGSLKLLELPSFESGLSFEGSGHLRKPSVDQPQRGVPGEENNLRLEQSSDQAPVYLGKPLPRDDSWGAVFAAGQSKENDPRQSISTAASDWESGEDLDRAIKDLGQVASRPTPTAATAAAAAVPSPPPNPPPRVPIPALPQPPTLTTSISKPLSSSTTPSAASKKPTHLTIAVGLPPLVPFSPSSTLTPVADTSRESPIETAPLKVRRRQDSSSDASLTPQETVPSPLPASSSPLGKSDTRRGSSSALSTLAKFQSEPVANLVLPKGDVPRSAAPRQLLTTRAARAGRVPGLIRHRDLADKMMQCLQSMQTTAARAPLIRGILLPVLYDDERRGYDPRQVDDNKAMRGACFDWLVTLLQKGIWLEQTANERGAVLEAVAALLESPALSIQALETDPVDGLIFRKIMRTVVSFVMTKLSSKGIFQNTLSFAGRMLAFAFFRVEGIAQQLLTALPVTRIALTRLETQVYESEAAAPDNTYIHETESFPNHLAPFVFQDSRQYLASVGTAICSFDDPDDEAAFRFQPGNWLRRWQSDDSELFFAFFRAYHKMLVGFFPSVADSTPERKMKASALLGTPGYAHLATIFANKCLSYIQGKVVSVTTTASSATFNSSETAFAAASGKPSVLENANRRLSETVNFLLATPALVDIQSGTEVEGTKVWGAMSDVWIRFSVGRTNLYEPKGVFCLFDLLDAITDLPPDPFKDTSIILPPAPSAAFSTSFVISTLEIILRNGDHALTLCKCVSYVFQHWETLMASPTDRDRLLNLLLERETFERVALFWSMSVRSYFVRLIVFRLSHVKTAIGSDKKPTETEVLSLKMLNVRLEAVRRRFSELEPSVLGSLLEDEEAPPSAPSMQEHHYIPGPGISRSRSTISMIPTSSVETGRTSEDGMPSKENLSGSGRVEGGGNGTGTAEVIAGGGALGKATQWFKKSFAKKKRSASGNSLGAASSSSSMVSGKSLPGISEVADEETESYQQQQQQQQPVSNIYPLFTPLPAAPNPADFLSPTRSSFESTPASPADSFFSEKQEDSLLSADVYRVRSGLALPSSSPPNRVNSFSSSGHSPTKFSSFEGDEDTSTVTSRSTTPTSARPQGSQGVFSFEFATSPLSDSFDIPAPPPLSFGSAAATTSAEPTPTISQPPSPSPRMSRSFSRRSSLLTPLALSVLESLAQTGEQPKRVPLSRKPPKEKGYDKKLHPYCVRFFAEMEDTLLEYQEWYSEGGQGSLGDGSPPRLTVGWSFHDDDE